MTRALRDALRTNAARIAEEQIAIATLSAAGLQGFDMRTATNELKRQLELRDRLMARVRLTEQ